MTTQKEARMKSFGPYVAEFIGTFALIMVGAGSIIATQNMPAALIAVALAHGITIAVMGTILGPVSGGHFNPAVTIALAWGRLFPARNVLKYILAQLAGGVAAALLLVYFFQSQWQVALLGTPMLAIDVSATKGIIIEAVMTLFLMLAIYGTTIDRRAPRMGALFIGLIITVDILFGGPLTGAAMNPARTFGPAFAGWLAGAPYNPWSQHLVYWIGPIIGALAAHLVYKNFLREE